MSKVIKNAEKVLRKETKIEKKNERKVSRAKKIEEKLEKQALPLLRVQHIKTRIKRLSRRIEELEMQRQDLLRELKVNWLKERGGEIE
jgi:division protein CdvB (Snf7/Vps24/ESCRT-III family)